MCLVSGASAAGYLTHFYMDNRMEALEIRLITDCRMEAIEHDAEHTIEKLEGVDSASRRRDAAIGGLPVIIKETPQEHHEPDSLEEP